MVHRPGKNARTTQDVSRAKGKGPTGEVGKRRNWNGAHRRFLFPYQQIAIPLPLGAWRPADSFVDAFYVINYDQACETIRIRRFSAKRLYRS